MERTLYATLNQAWLIVLAGIGFMHIAATGDNVPNRLGFTLILAGTFLATTSYIIHVRRLQTFTRGEELNRCPTVLFNGIIVAMIFAALMFELCYGVLYPYYGTERAAAVSIHNSHEMTTEPTA